jgi:hypothetical protein
MVKIMDTKIMMGRIYHGRKISFCLILICGGLLSACSSGSSGGSSAQDDDQLLNCTITGLSESQEVVYDYNLYHTNVSGGDYSDNPVRPFLARQESGSINIGNNSYMVYWFASNSKGYCKSYGLPISESVPDILAQIRRVENESGGCETWVTSRFNDPTANLYPASTYYNELWMVVPYTLDGMQIMSLIHNEYHVIPNNVENVYGNLIGATSFDAASTFKLYQTDESNNKPVIVAPYPYYYPVTQGKGGMFAQTNIIKWGKYYYMLVNQVLNTLDESAPTSLCIYRTESINQYDSWRGWNQGTNTYSVPLVESYPSSIDNPTQYWCSQIPGLPGYFHYSWSYNVALHKFVLIGLDENYNNTGQSAFVYTLATLDPESGVLSAANGTTNYTINFLRSVNSIESWQDSESLNGQYYPSILDPHSPVLKDRKALVKVESGDLNFQLSGQDLYLYYTYFYPKTGSNWNGQIRDIVRQKILVKCQ